MIPAPVNGRHRRGAVVVLLAVLESKYAQHGANPATLPTVEDSSLLLRSLVRAQSAVAGSWVNGQRALLVVEMECRLVV
jgi:hypothetical protein